MVMPRARPRSLIKLICPRATLPRRLPHRAGAIFTGFLSADLTFAWTAVFMFLCPRDACTRYP